MTAFQNNFDHTKPFSDTQLQLLLAANTAISYTVPGADTKIYRALFRAASTAEIWVRLNGTAAVPTSNTVTQTAYQEFLPVEPRYVKGGDTLSFISTGTPSVGVSLLQVQDIS